MFDCHTHVQFAAFDADWKETIERSLAAGVSLVNVGTQADTSRRAVEVAKAYSKGVYAAIGLHPVHTTRSYHDEHELGGGEAAQAFVSRGEAFDYEFYAALAKDSKVVAIGECGLDYYRPTGDPTAYKQLQKEVFLAHANIAKDVGKALMIHCRPSKGTDDAYEDMLELLSDNKFAAVVKILHFYVGSVAMTKKFLDAGFYFEFGGVITFARDYDESIKMIPLNRILTETDAPYVAPEAYRGKRNEPAYVVEVVKQLAQIKGCSVEEVMTTTDATARRVFQIDGA